MTTEQVRLTIDGIPISVPKGTLVIEAARRVGVMVPHFCYHPKLKPDANCRMCLVEVEKMPKLRPRAARWRLKAWPFGPPRRLFTMPTSRCSNLSWPTIPWIARSAKIGRAHV